VSPPLAAGLLPSKDQQPSQSNAPFSPILAHSQLLVGVFPVPEEFSLLKIQVFEHETKPEKYQTQTINLKISFFLKKNIIYIPSFQILCEHF
jgi:hypothetical protein